MRDFHNIVSKLREHKDDLSKKYSVNRIGIFGSFARGEESESSDVDILVELSKPIGLDFVSLGDELEELLQIKVDLLSKNSLKQSLRQVIEEEIFYV